MNGQDGDADVSSKSKGEAAAVIPVIAASDSDEEVFAGIFEDREDESDYEEEEGPRRRKSVDCIHQVKAEKEKRKRQRKHRSGSAPKQIPLQFTYWSTPPPDLPANANANGGCPLNDIDENDSPETGIDQEEIIASSNPLKVLNTKTNGEGEKAPLPPIQAGAPSKVVGKENAQRRSSISISKPFGDRLTEVIKAVVLDVLAAEGILSRRHSFNGVVGSSDRQGRQGEPLVNQNQDLLGSKKKSAQMRLRSKSKQMLLHSNYCVHNDIVDKDADVIFICGDGGRVKGHKLILASASKLFTEIFREQPVGEVSMVSVPEVSSDIMKLIVLLAYKCSVVVNAAQAKSLKTSLQMFDMDDLSIHGPEHEEVRSELDVLPGKVLENIQQRPRLVPLNRLRGPGNAGDQSINRKRNFPISLPNGGAGHFDECGPPEAKRKAPSHSAAMHYSSMGENPEESMIKQWADSVGKISQDVTITKRTPIRPVSLKCNFCTVAFSREDLWKWHTIRHRSPGGFKCTFCHYMQHTPRGIWLHEERVHRYTPIPLQAIETKTAVRQPPKLIDQRLLHRNPNGGSNIGLSLIPGQDGQWQFTRRSQPEVNTFHRSDNSFRTGVGEYSRNGGFDQKRSKQNWLYVCAGCDNCSDNVESAQEHFFKCYPAADDMGVEFESTVSRYRPKFYDRYRCPICPKRSVSNGGFVLHAEHQHEELRRLFSFATFEGKLKCLQCNRKFDFADEFYRHLMQEPELMCMMEPIDEDAVIQRAAQTRLAESEMIMKEERKEASKPKPKPQMPPPTPPPAPKSARLAKRASLKANNNAGGKEKEEDSLSHPSYYPPVDCPICGNSDIPNISRHLAFEHKEIDVSVSRVSTDLLRCRRCRTTFAICDLLSHSANCQKNDEKTDLESNEVVKRKAPPVDRPPAIIYEIPPGIGTSPIEKMECSVEELMTTEFIQKGLTCPVCSRTGRKLGDIKNCLRGHGILRCSLCFNTYKTKGESERHTKTCHLSNIGKPICPVCRTTFVNAGQVVNHLHHTHWNKALQAKPATITSFTTPDPSVSSDAEGTDATGSVATHEENDLDKMDDISTQDSFAMSAMDDNNTTTEDASFAISEGEIKGEPPSDTSVEDIKIEENDDDTDERPFQFFEEMEIEEGVEIDGEELEESDGVEGVGNSTKDCALD